MTSGRLVLSRFAADPPTAFRVGWRYERLKEIVHDRTTQANDRGSPSSELLRQHDPRLHKQRCRFRPLLSQVARQDGPRGDPAVSVVSVGPEKARLVNVGAENCSIEVLLHAHAQRALVRAGGRQAQGAAPLADRAEL